MFAFSLPASAQSNASVSLSCVNGRVAISGVYTVDDNSWDQWVQMVTDYGSDRSVGERGPLAAGQTAGFLVQTEEASVPAGSVLFVFDTNVGGDARGEKEVAYRAWSCRR